MTSGLFTVKVSDKVYEAIEKVWDVPFSVAHVLPIQCPPVVQTLSLTLSYIRVMSVCPNTRHVCACP